MLHAEYLSLSLHTQNPWQFPEEVQLCKPNRAWLTFWIIQTVWFEWTTSAFEQSLPALQKPWMRPRLTVAGCLAWAVPSASFNHVAKEPCRDQAEQCPFTACNTPARTEAGLSLSFYCSQLGTIWWPLQTMVKLDSHKHTPSQPLLSFENSRHDSLFWVLTLPSKIQWNYYKASRTDFKQNGPSI